MDYAKASRRRRKTQLVLYIAFLAVCAISILLMPVAGTEKEASKLLPVIFGGGFWVGLIGTVFVAININNSRKRSYVFKYRYYDAKQFGLISFFKNKEAKIADITMFASIICLIITRIFVDNIYWMFIFLALFVFSFGMHCMLNGKNYVYLKQKVRRGDSHDLHEKNNV